MRAMFASTSLGSPDQGTNGADQLFLAERLRDVTVRSDYACFGLVEETVLARQHDDRRRLELAVVLDERAGLIAVEARHHDVDEDDLRTGVRDLREGIEAIGRSGDFASRLREQRFGAAADRLRVVDDQNFDAAKFLFHNCPFSTLAGRPRAQSGPTAPRHARACELSPKAPSRCSTVPPARSIK